MHKVTVTAPLPRTTPEAAGVSSSAVRRFIDRCAERGQRLHSFIMARDGIVFSEGYYKPYTDRTLQTVYSLSKSFTSFAVGLAIDDGVIGIDDIVIDFFPDADRSAADERILQLTVRNLLRMSTGQAVEPSFFRDNWIQAFFNEPTSEYPGEVFRYNTCATCILAAILHKKGIRHDEMLQARLFDKIGIDGVRWMRMPDGEIATGGFGMSIFTEAIAKFGQLLIQDGVWNGERIISHEYLALATSKQIENNPTPENPPTGDWQTGYGYQFWICNRPSTIRGDGMHSQFCVVSRDKRAVFAATAYCNDMQGILESYYEEILDRMAATPLVENKAANTVLNVKLNNLAVKSAINTPVDKISVENLFGKSIGSCGITVCEIEGMYKIRLLNTEFYCGDNTYLPTQVKSRQFSEPTAVYGRAGMIDGKFSVELSFVELLIFVLIQIDGENVKFVKLEPNSEIELTADDVVNGI